MDVSDQPKENYLALSKKCFRYKVPIYFIQQNDFLFSLSPTKGEKMLTGNLGKLGQCYIFLEPDMIENNKAASRRWSKVGSYLFRVPSPPPHPISLG